ncbi:hypothetical protein LX36DRAFT_48573 [Colletotrichum falcatum]|nr:hypothetical protein LX36DRAFT_48573 [Colletotrichum falcatum]
MGRTRVIYHREHLLQIMTEPNANSVPAPGSTLWWDAPWLPASLSLSLTHTQSLTHSLVLPLLGRGMLIKDRGGSHWKSKRHGRVKRRTTHSGCPVGEWSCVEQRKRCVGFTICPAGRSVREVGVPNPEFGSVFVVCTYKDMAIVVHRKYVYIQ